MLMHRTASRGRSFAAWATAFALVLGLLPAASAWGQARRAAGSEKEELPEPEDLTLTTGDGVQLGVTYYGSLEGKDAVPIIMLHMLEGSRSDYAGLAQFLQQQGHAILTVDLRGHGDSKTSLASSRPLDPKTMRPDDFRRIVSPAGDIEACKAFLIQRNNAGELNIEKLCVVGAGFGGLAALEWARLDWSWPPLATGKQGQDVKALVLLSPEWSAEGLSAKDAMGHPAVREELSILLLVGKQDSGAYRSARQLEGIWKRYHPIPPADKAAEQRTFFYAALDTKLQGTKLLGVKNLNVEVHIAQFIELRLMNKSYPWRERSIGLP